MSRGSPLHRAKFFKTPTWVCHFSKFSAPRSLAVLLVHMLRNGRQPALRARQATALGLLLRHATHIVDELCSTSADVSLLLAASICPMPNL